MRRPLTMRRRATQSAPNDAQLWFLLGYAERLDGKLQLAVDAYNRGLRLKPSALDGISGLAQTYSIMGKTDEAKLLLNQVLSADPKRINDAVLLGEILLRLESTTTRSMCSGARKEFSKPRAQNC